MKLILIFLFSLFIACSNNSAQKEIQTAPPPTENLVAFLDTIFRMEQEPIRLRDSIMKIHGDESKEFLEQQNIYRKNHAINEKKIRTMLDNSGWPKKEIIGERGNRTICNVIQHAENNIRIKYLPMMKQAVLDKKLNPQLLVRTEDRIATENGELQIYGGQMKFYPETKSFNVWPAFDPVNIDKRRAEIGLGPIANYLQNRFDFEWNLEEQIKRTEDFKKQMKKEKYLKNFTEADSTFLVYINENIITNPEEKKYISDFSQLKSIQLINCDKKNIHYKDKVDGKEIELKLSLKKFEKENHKINLEDRERFDPQGVRYIDGKEPWGNYTVPHTEIDNLEIWVNGNEIKMEQEFKDIYNLDLCDLDYKWKIFDPNPLLKYDEKNKVFYLYVKGGKTSFHFFGKFIFDENQFIKRYMLDYGDLSPTGSFRIDFKGF